MRRGLLVVGGLVAIIGLVVALKGQKRSPEAEVRALVAQCVAAAEKRDVGPIADAIADDFHGGGLSKTEVKQLLLGHLFRNQNALVVLNPVLDVKANAHDASFSGVFVFARAREVNWRDPGDGVSRYDIEGTLEYRDGDWFIVTAEWKR